MPNISNQDFKMQKNSYFLNSSTCFTVFFIWNTGIWKMEIDCWNQNFVPTPFLKWWAHVGWKIMKPGQHFLNWKLNSVSSFHRSTTGKLLFQMFEKFKILCKTHRSYCGSFVKLVKVTCSCLKLIILDPSSFQNGFNS